jgi:hypothetical protein
MVRPEDLAKFFEGGLPNWIEKPPPEKPADEKKSLVVQPIKIPPNAVAGHIPVMAKLGITGVARMYAFFKPESTIAPSQEGNPFTAEITRYSADDMMPLGKHPKVVSKPWSRGMWSINGQITPGTVVKVFVGHTNEPTYGMYYYIADDYAKVVQILHPEENLYVYGKFTKVTEEMYSDLDLRRPPARSGGLPVRIVEEQ